MFISVIHAAPRLRAHSVCSMARKLTLVRMPRGSHAVVFFIRASEKNHLPGPRPFRIASKNILLITILCVSDAQKKKPTFCTNTNCNSGRADRKGSNRAPCSRAIRARVGWNVASLPCCEHHMAKQVFCAARMPAKLLDLGATGAAVPPAAPISLPDLAACESRL